MRVSTFLFFLSYATLRLSYATPRRILHQPFFPLESPPSQTHSSPSPPPQNSPFFPFYPSPPPPPSPSAFATLPANLSSLILPHSPKPRNNSRKILVASLAAAAFLSLVIMVIFLILHKRRTNDRVASDEKTYTSYNSSKNAGPTRNKNGTYASASAEFLYVGTVVNSRNLEVESGRNSSTNSGSGHGKLDSYSPELRPLPPLKPRHIFRDGNTTTEDDQEEFYSPRGSTPGSPDRSESPTISPPASSSPPPKTTGVPVTPPPPPPPPPPPKPMQRPKDHRITSRPPPLIPASRPFKRSGVTKGSPVELSPKPSWEGRVEEENTPKPKLKALHWDKVRASSDREMVWDHLSASSFKLNEEMMETLFVVNTPTPKPKQPVTRAGCAIPVPNQENRVLDPKKAQNIAILLRALNVTIEEVCEALLEGNADTLGAELLESLMKMAPTKEEERKLKDYKDDSPSKLGHAEKFLKAVLDVPFAFKRVEAMLYMANFETEVEYLKRSFETLELACEELRNSKMFLKLLEAVLKTGNRMNVGTNRGDARAFKLDTLLKLVDVKGVDGKTTLLHFVVQEIIRTEGARISGANQNPNSTASEDAKCRKLGLQVVSGLSSELANVKKAAGMDSDILSSDVSKLSRGLQFIGEVERLNETLVSDETAHRFSESMKRFVKMAEGEIIKIQAQESVALSLVKEITEYFHGNSAKEEAHPFRIFMVVRDFLGILDRVCKEVGTINERTVVNSAYKFPVPVNPTMPQVFSAPNVVRQCSSSDEES